ASRPGLDRIRRPPAARDPHPTRRRRTRAGLAANHPAPAPLRRVRAENRPRHPRHPALPLRLSPGSRHRGPLDAPTVATMTDRPLGGGTSGGGGVTEAGAAYAWKIAPIRAP